MDDTAIIIGAFVGICSASILIVIIVFLENWLEAKIGQKAIARSTTQLNCDHIWLDATNYEDRDIVLNFKAKYICEKCSKMEMR